MIVLVIVVLMCISDNAFLTIVTSKEITFRADRTITRNIRSMLLNNNIISSSSHSTTAVAVVSNSIIDSNDHNDDDSSDMRQPDLFAEWFRRKDSPLVILNSNPGIVSVEELDHQQRYQANISPLQFPCNSLNMLDGGLVSISSAVSIMS